MKTFTYEWADHTLTFIAAPDRETAYRILDEFSGVEPERLKPYIDPEYGHGFAITLKPVLPISEDDEGDLVLDICNDGVYETVDDFQNKIKALTA